MAVPQENVEESMPAQIKSVDMSDDMADEAIDVCRQAMIKHSVEKDIAQYIKKAFDEKRGPTWHCIVGRNFGSFVTHGIPPLALTFLVTSF
ncbi:dynein light chain [Sclerotinia borealis F-4128]|uniref:Dynein light chain n=1 Tax=Sclerotinia borealis (strain F-4128) TaxID=1432307 RepID=W9CS92_SCLBF|nr:dynein light chain [Sclerotinia borealis F-4128]